MSSKVKVGLLSPFFTPISGYEQAAQSLGLDLVIVTASRINWGTLEVDGLVWDGRSWDPKTVPVPRAMYNRYYGPKPKIVARLESIIGKNKIFNHITRFDKWEMHKILTQSGLKELLPATELYTPRVFLAFLEKFGQVVLKPQGGQLGTDVYLVRKEHRRYHLHNGTRYPIATLNSPESLVARIEPLVSKNFIVQQFIPLAAVDGRIFDLRFLVQKDERGDWKITGALSRFALRYSYITNVSQAITGVEATLQQVFRHGDFLRKLEEISIKGAQIAEQSLGSLGELSVDLGLDEQGKLWIIELNAKPMKSTFEALNDDQLLSRVYQTPLAYARHLATT